MEPSSLPVLPPKVSLTPSELRHTGAWIEMLIGLWIGDVPISIHARGAGPAPPFHPEFIRYIGFLPCKVPTCKDQRCRRPRRRLHGPTRAKRAFSRLRDSAPIEFDVLWLAVRERLSFEEIADRLNERALRGQHPERYSVESVMFLAALGIDKVSKWF